MFNTNTNKHNNNNNNNNSWLASACLAPRSASPEGPAARTGLLVDLAIHIYIYIYIYSCIVV